MQPKSNQMSLFLRKSRAHLALGQSAAFCAEVLPLAEAALGREEAIADLAARTAAALAAQTAAGGGGGGDGDGDETEGGGGRPELPKVLRRALVRVGKEGVRAAAGGEEESVFKGYTSK
jgi:hypothetical protein